MSDLVYADTLLDLRAAIDSAPRVLVEFGAPWCGPCTSFLPHFKRFAAKRPDIVCVKVDVDVDPAVVSEYKIQSVPQVMLFEDGQYVRTLDSTVRSVVALDREFPVTN